MFKISGKITGENDTGTNTEFSPTTLNENLLSAKNQSNQRDTPKITFSNSAVYLLLMQASEARTN